jgi:hypothetical protein
MRRRQFVFALPGAMLAVRPGKSALGVALPQPLLLQADEVIQ